MEKKTVSKNGIAVYSYKNKNLHSFCISLYVKTGPMYENEDENGITHFTEHLVFRNINFLMGGELYKTLDRLGMEFTGCTYKEFMQLKITGAAKHFDEAADILLKALLPIALPLDEINLERRRIKAEMREESEKTTLDYYTQHIIWKGTTLSQSILGKNSVVSSAGKAALADAHSRIFSAEHMFFYITGNFKDEAVECMTQKLGSIELQKGEKRDNIANVPQEFMNRNCGIYIKRDSDSPFLRFSFDVDVSRYSCFELDLLYDLLFRGDNCKLFQELSEKTGYIYSYDSYFEQYANVGNLYFKFEVQNSNLINTIKVIAEIFRDIKANLGDELCYVLPIYTDNAEMVLDDAEELNWQQAYERHILCCTDLDIKQKKNKYREVSKERIMQICSEIFTPQALVLTMKALPEKVDVKLIRNILMTI